MKYYAQFTHINNTKWNQETCERAVCAPYHQDKLGSDGVFILDGRNSLFTMIQDAKNQANRLTQVATIDGLRIMKAYEGRFSNARQVHFQEYSNK